MTRRLTGGLGPLKMGLIVFGTLLGGEREGAGQETFVPAGTITGTVVSADGSQPLEQADVVLVPAGATFTGWASASTLPPGALYRLTRADGFYRFAAVPSGHYHLYVQRLGYRPTVLDVELSEEAALRLSVGLVMAPIQLRPVEVTARAKGTYNRDMSFDEEIEFGRIATEHRRQDAFLESDVRVLTHIDVIEAITLGDTDIFRALHRAPGVSTRDDWTSELWVRGASWGQTRVYFDGMPLFNPVHNAGLVSAINSDAVGSVTLHPGVRSASIGDGAAGILNIESSPAGGHGDFRGYAGSSLTNFAWAMQKRMFGQRLGVSVAVRESEDTKGTLLPWSGKPSEKRVLGGTGELPDDFFDIIGHIDLELDDERRVEISGIVEQDRIQGGIDGGPVLNQMTWGNMAGRVTVELPFRGARLRQTVGFSRFETSVTQDVPRPRLAAFDYPPTQQPTNNEIDYLSLAGELAPRYPDESSEWRGGYQLAHLRVNYLGAPATPFPVQTALYRLLIKQDVTVAALWAEQRWRQTERLSMQAGLRLEVGDGLGEDWGVGVAPRLSARYALTDQLSVSGAAGRAYQYLHALAPSGLRIGPRLPTAYIQVLAGEDGIGAIRSDVATLGAEYWLSRSWLASANAYVRYAHNIEIPDPTPGSIDEHQLRVPADNLARGLEFSARRLAGRWTASFAYTLAKSELMANGLRFASPSDRTHQFDATFTTRFPRLFLGGSTRLGSAFNAASGAPYTRVHLGTYNCTDPDGQCQAIVPNTAGDPNAQRSSWARRFDLFVDWTREFKAWQLGFYVQMQNVTNAERGVTYAVNQNECRREAQSDPFCGAEQDEFVPGVGSIQVVGVRVAW